MHGFSRKNNLKSAEETAGKKGAGRVETKVFQNQDTQKSGTARGEPIFYIYDRVTTRSQKDAEMRRRFGHSVSRAYDRPRQTGSRRIVMNGPFPGNTPPKAPSDVGAKTQIFRKPAGTEPHRPTRGKGRPAGKTGPERMRYARFEHPGGGNTGGAATVPKHKKLLLDSIVNFFDTIEERWQRDVDSAKKQAVLRRKFVEHRRGLFLALVILAILALFVFGVYRLFFVIRHVEVDTASAYSAGEIQSAAGIADGDTLYSFRSADAADAITFRLPYIKSAAITRTIPSSVTIVTENDEMRYYTEIYGETVALSGGLRVLGPVAPDTAAAAGAIRLYLPAVEKAVAGRVLVFRDAKKERAIRELLAETEKSVLSDRIGMIDVRSEQNIQMNCDGAYRLTFGSGADAGLKLRMANKTISDSLFETGMLARIDLSATGVASVQYDLRLDLSAVD